VDPEISIIISTHNNSPQLLRLLESLGRQAIDPGYFEVIVVAWGCEEQTMGVLRSLSTPYALRLLDLPCSNQAAARNRGGQVARAQILMFLEDDVEASELLVAAHLRELKRQPGGVVLGYSPISQNLAPDDLFTDLCRLEWSEIFTRQMKPSYRFNFFDLNGINLSLPRDLFTLVGGYDENLLAYEDFEFGFRLLKQHARFYFVPDAACIRSPMLSEADLFQRIAAEGRAHLQILRKHPELRASFPLGYDAYARAYDGYKLTRLSRNRLFHNTTHKLILSCLSLPLNFAKILKLREIYDKILKYIISYSYWRGVLLELGSPQALNEFIHDLPTLNITCNEIEIDLKTDGTRLDELLALHPVDAAFLRYDDTPIGYIAPVVGAEALRRLHLLDALTHEFAGEFLNIIHPDGRKIPPRFVSAIDYRQPDALFAPIILFNAYDKELNNYRDQFILLISGAWHQIEYDNGIPYYWLEEDSCLFIYSRKSGLCNIGFQAEALFNPRTLKIIVNDLISDVLKIQPNGPEIIELLTSLRQGINIIGLHIVEGTEKPCEIPEMDSKDPRPLGIAIKNIRIADSKSIKTDPIFSIAEKYRNIIFIILSNGWFRQEIVNDFPARWISDNASCRLILMNRCRFELSLKAMSFYRSRTLEISLDEKLLSRFVISEKFKTINMRIELEKGDHKIGFHVPEGCERPCDKMSSKDKRCLSISLCNIRIE
jgi:glycosyltransferase involved in cell wall biosynthesis